MIASPGAFLENEYAPGSSLNTESLWVRICGIPVFLGTKLLHQNSANRAVSLPPTTIPLIRLTGARDVVYTGSFLSAGVAEFFPYYTSPGSH